VAGPRGEDGQGSACREKAFVCFVGEFAGGEGGVGAARVAVWRIVAAGKEELGESGARAGIGTEKGGSPNPGAVERPSLPLAGSSFSRGKTGGSGGFARGAVLEANQGAPGFSIICESRSFSDSNFGHSTSQLYVPFFLFEMANGPVWFG
jgi:hypothetical protein